MLKNILVFIIVFGVISAGVIGILLTLGVTEAAQSREALIQSLSVIGIIAIVAIISLYALRMTQKK